MCFLQRQEVIWVTPHSHWTIVYSYKYNLALSLHEALNTLYRLIMKWFDIVYLTEGIGLNQKDSIFACKRKKDPWLTNNFLLQSSISGSIKILSPFFLYGCLWLLGRGEITVIQMLSDFNTPVNIRKERTTPSSIMPRKKRWDQCFEYPICLPLLYLVTSHYLCSKQTAWHIQNTVLCQSSLRLNHVHKHIPAAVWETVSLMLSCQQVFNPLRLGIVKNGLIMAANESMR